MSNFAIVSPITFLTLLTNVVSKLRFLPANKTNGYLNSEFIWTQDDLYYSFNGVDYLVCARNTPFKMGYKFIILPISSLTEEQRDSHVFPPVYVVIADSMSVRQIVINGDAY